MLMDIKCCLLYDCWQCTVAVNYKGGVWHRGLWTIITTSRSSRSDRQSVFVTNSAVPTLALEQYDLDCRVMCIIVMPVYWLIKYVLTNVALRVALRMQQVRSEHNQAVLRTPVNVQ